MQTLIPSFALRAIPAAIGALLLAGCATVTAPTPAPAPAPAPAAPHAASTPPAVPGSATAAAAVAAVAAAARPPTGALQPFAEVTRDAKRSEGYLDIWTKDEKTWIEIPAARLNEPFFFTSWLTQGVGGGLWPGLPASRAQVVFLRRVGHQVQLVARNYHARATDGTPLAQALAESYSESLIASAPLAAAPHPERKSLLVDANALMGGDITGAQTQLEAMFRLPYALDRANSSIERTRTQASGTTMTLRSHFALAKLPAPPVFAPGAPPPNPAALPNPPSNVPDARSLFLSFAYTLAPLPAQPMAPRLADQRVGYFTEGYIDFADDNGGDRRTHLVRRWRLEKKDPTAAVSEPKEPIRVVMDRNIPEKWRPTLKSGILEWNKAFEKAGWRNAIVVEQQAADADWSSLEGTRILAVRWFAIDGPGATAVGPSQSDPRTGEILRGAAIIPENWARFERLRVKDQQPPLPGATAAIGHEAECSYAEDALEDARFGYDLLAMRGELDPDSPEAERFISQALKDVTMHEVGHALGLRHNFKASSGVKQAQLRDEAFTASHGVSNSVMDYNALNMPLPGEPASEYHMLTLGAYDYWAIEYGYRDFPAGTEKQALASLAAQGDRDPTLAYGTDEDLGANDPLVNQRDLGDDPLAYAQRQIKLARELWQRTQERKLAADDDMTIYRRNLQRGLSFIGAAVPIATKYVGGTYTSRALAGSGQALLTPVPAAQQRAALNVVLSEVFASSSFRFDPRFMSRLGVDQLDRLGPNRFQVSTDFSLPGAVQSIQRGALDSLMSEGLALRLADAESKVDDPKTLLNYADVQAQLSASVWSELKGGKAGRSGARDIDSLRRNLQREHLKRLAGGLLRPTSVAAADVQSVNRQVALQLAAELKTALAAGGWSSIARAHLAESLATLDETLKAPLLKQGV
jgi:hypothetical protein